MEQTNFKRISQSFLCACFAIFLFNIFYFLGRGAIYLLDEFRGLDSDLIQGIGMEIIIPYIGGFVAASLSKKKFENSISIANKVIYSILFLVIFFLVYINLDTVYFKNSDSIRIFLLCVLPFAGTVGAIFGFMKK